MTAPRYITEISGSQETTQRALDAISLDVDGLEADITALSGSLSAVPYTPGNPSDWVAPPPSNLQAALDRIAAALGPIP